MCFFGFLTQFFFKPRPDGGKRIADSGSPKKGLPGKYVLFLETNSCWPVLSHKKITAMEVEKENAIE